MCTNPRSRRSYATSTMAKRPNQTRRGVAAVEFAVVAPLLVAISVGMIVVNRTFEAQNLLEVAAREGARFASMERDGLVADGQSSNDKLAEDIANFLATNGIARDKISVAVKDHDDPSADFDLDDPDNDLRLFEVHVSVDYSAISYMPVDVDSDYAMSAAVVFRNGRSTLSD